MGETEGRDRVKGLNIDIRISITQTTAVSENALTIEHHTLCNEETFLERVPHGYGRRSKEAIPKRLHLTASAQTVDKKITEARITMINNQTKRRELLGLTFDGYVLLASQTHTPL